MVEIQLNPSWKAQIGGEFEKDYMLGLNAFLLEEKQNGQIVYPQSTDIFSAFNCTPFDKVKVVVLGQDPYHGAGQAHGLSFSVPQGVSVPSSLRNIYKELLSDVPDFIIPKHGNLTAWAQQGVLLLNATLTVRANQAGSHQKKGWEQFTDTIITTLSEQKKDLVFLLWGNFAKSKATLIDAQKHLVLTAPHPSPFSAWSGFFGCGHFSKTNAYLQQTGQEPISWNLFLNQ